jgi:hypothetical protein
MAILFPISIPWKDTKVEVMSAEPNTGHTCKQVVQPPSALRSKLCMSRRTSPSCGLDIGASFGGAAEVWYNNRKVAAGGG